MNFDILYDDKCVYRLQSKDIPELQAYLKKKDGWIYIAKSKDNKQLKIGRTGKNPMERAKTLSTTGVLNEYEIVFSAKVFNQYWAEKAVHNKLKNFRVKLSKEFFSVNEDVAINAFQVVCEEEAKLMSRFFNLDVLKADIDLLEHAIIKN